MSLLTLGSLGPEQLGAAGAECVRGGAHRDGQTGGQLPGQNPVHRAPSPELAALGPRRDRAQMTRAPLEGGEQEMEEAEKHG